MTQRKQQQRPRAFLRSGKIVVAIIIGIVVMFVVVDALIAKAYSGKIYSGVSVGEERVGTMSYDAALERVTEKMSAIEGEGLTLQYGKDSILLEFTLADTSGLGLTVNAVEYDPENSVKAAFGFGRNGGWLTTAAQRLRAALSPVRVQPKMSLNEEYLRRALDIVLKKYERPARETGFELKSDNSVVVTFPKEGEIFDREKIIAALRDRLTRLANNPIEITLVRDTPSTTGEDGERLLEHVQALVNKGSLTLEAGDKKLLPQPQKYISWLQPSKVKNKVSLGISDDAVTTYLKDVQSEVTVPPKEAKFNLKNGKVTEFQVSSAGTELEIAASIEAIAKAIREGTTDVVLTLKTVQPQASADKISNLGIVELVAVGKTNFSGSPPNRRHNIKIGADLLNGLLIKPGEEFSLVKAIGPVDATLGYKQELVIKGDRTIPEFGGGLCQIGTTFFRLVLNAGLPVLERKNHSYRVRYYEPPVGMDATIYEPKPDFRFKNDYASHLLLQTRIEGDDLVYEFWGKKDGREVETTAPRVYNTVAPPAQLTIETTDLKPGETKCTEKAHIGSDAEFTYTVTYRDGEKKEVTFKSHYKPWRAVCFVGVKPGEAGSGSPAEPDVAGEIKKKENGADEKKNGTNANANANVSANVNSAPANTNSSSNENTNTTGSVNINANANSNTNSGE